MKKGILLFFLLSGCALSGGVELFDLRGKTMREVERYYGKPVVVRHEGEHQMWAYKNGACRYLIFFDDSHLVQYAESNGKCMKD